MIQKIVHISTDQKQILCLVLFLALKGDTTLLYKIDREINEKWNGDGI